MKINTMKIELNKNTIYNLNCANSIREFVCKHVNHKSLIEIMFICEDEAIDTIDMNLTASEAMHLLVLSVVKHFIDDAETCISENDEFTADIIIKIIA